MQVTSVSPGVGERFPLLQASPGAPGSPRSYPPPQTSPSTQDTSASTIWLLGTSEFQDHNHPLSSLAKDAAHGLGRELVELDQAILQDTSASTIQELQHAVSWAEFRALELSTVERLVTQKPLGAVVVAGARALTAELASVLRGLDNVVQLR